MKKLFRVWDERNSHFLDKFAIDEKGQILVYDWHTDAGKSYETEIGRNNDDFVIEQSCNITDKAGKEVFEGDVVKCKAEGSTWNMRATISGEFLDLDESYVGGCEMKIIGNIHQNPDLLK